ncbi:MAG: hypothetical protein ACRDBO_22480 [Lachnospiraceae bacterium]
MDDERFYQKLMQQIAGVSKTVLRQKKLLIMQLYEDMAERLSLDSSHEIEMGYNDDALTIKIRFREELLLTEFDDSMNKLLLLANYRRIVPGKSFVLLEMWYRCWEYEEKEDSGTLH